MFRLVILLLCLVLALWLSESESKITLGRPIIKRPRFKINYYSPKHLKKPDFNQTHTPNVYANQFWSQPNISSQVMQVKTGAEYFNV